ncbi:MAG: LysM peptidoglycan-binding domain-containing protein [Arcobacteraceae bacterium]
MRYLFIVLLLSYSLFANIMELNDVTRTDLEILNEFDIEPDFLANLELQESYNNFALKEKDYFIESFNSSLLLIPTVKSILAKEDVPSVMLYVGMAESNFDVKSHSNMGAKGLWQFIPDTAKKFGLSNDKYIDERLDIEKSTIAASKYLKRLHNLFGKWYLAAIAYNCGEGRLVEGIVRLSLDKYIEKNPNFEHSQKFKEYRKVIKNYQNRKNNHNELFKVYREIKSLNIDFTLSELLEIQEITSRQYIPKESRNHIRKIVAFAIMLNKELELNEQNPHLLNRGMGDMIVFIETNGGFHLKNIAEASNLSYEDILTLNSHLKQEYIPNNKSKYRIYIPYYALQTYHENKNNIKPTILQKHIVKQGDSLNKISSLYGISSSYIQEFNDLKSDKIKPNQELLIPFKEGTKIVVKKTKQKEYIVQKGDTLSTIALKQKVSLKKLMGDNKLNSSNISIGDKLVINN